MSDFWDQVVEGLNKRNSSVAALTESVKKKSGLSFPVKEGTRVSFGNALGDVLAYRETPEFHEEGTVVKVKTSSGEVTGVDNHVFVKWDNGMIGQYAIQHLKRVSGKTAGLLDDFMSVTASDELVHVSNEDLWAFDGSVISRLFDKDVLDG